MRRRRICVADGVEEAEEALAVRMSWPLGFYEQGESRF
jgi:hypothetical protein